MAGDLIVCCPHSPPHISTAPPTLLLSGLSHEASEALSRRLHFNARPPTRRPSFTALRVEHPFCPGWLAILGLSAPSWEGEGRESVPSQRKKKRKAAALRDGSSVGVERKQEGVGDGGRRGEARGGKGVEAEAEGGERRGEEGRRGEKRMSGERRGLADEGVAQEEMIAEEKGAVEEGGEEGCGEQSVADSHPMQFCVLRGEDIARSFLPSLPPGLVVASLPPMLQPLLSRCLLRVCLRFQAKGCARPPAAIHEVRWRPSLHTCMHASHLPACFPPAGMLHTCLHSSHLHACFTPACIESHLPTLFTLARILPTCPYASHLPTCLHSHLPASFPPACMLHTHLPHYLLPAYRMHASHLPALFTCVQPNPIALIVNSLSDSPPNVRQAAPPSLRAWEATASWGGSELPRSRTAPSPSAGLLGFVTSGGYSHLLGRSVAIGFCAAAPLVRLLQGESNISKTAAGPIRVLVRNVSSRQFRPALLTICA